jgi:hypothetical protein
MTLKPVLLVLLVILATAATSFTFQIPSTQTSGKNVDSTKSYRIAEIGNDTLDEPIDTPGGPGIH